MSGGHFCYKGSKISWDLAEIADDNCFKKRFPNLSNLLIDLGKKIEEIEHQVDFDICGDKKFEKGDKEMEKFFIGTIVDICLKNSPDEWFPRGKWATIQAIQQRVENSI